jgi:hypothetical protein
MTQIPEAERALIAPGRRYKSALAQLHALSAELRPLVLDARAAGATYAVLAARTGLAPSTITRWLKTDK